MNSGHRKRDTLPLHSEKTWKHLWLLKEPERTDRKRSNPSHHSSLRDERPKTNLHDKICCFEPVLEGGGGLDSKKRDLREGKRHPEGE
jgi:hypothetical protein